MIVRNACGGLGAPGGLGLPQSLGLSRHTNDGGGAPGTQVGSSFVEGSNPTLQLHCK